jgi:hypothetical protein
MIAIALGKPVYVLGGASGAARATGQLLGLDATTPDLRRCLAPALWGGASPRSRRILRTTEKTATGLPVQKKVRFAHDSALGETVLGELVSEPKFPW